MQLLPIAFFLIFMLSPLLVTRKIIHYRDQEERGLKHFPFKQPFWNFRHGVESEVNDKRFSGFLYWKNGTLLVKGWLEDVLLLSGPFITRGLMWRQEQWGLMIKQSSL